MNTEIDKSLQAIMEIAADWFVRSREAELSLADQKEFAHWLNESPLHVHEYLTIARMWGDINEIHGIEKLEFTIPGAPIDDGRNVVSLSDTWVGDADGNAVQTQSISAPKRVARWRAFAIAASLVAVVGLGSVGRWYNVAPPGYHVTALGEQRSLILEDNSVVEMNTESEIAVNFENSERIVTLLAGEVLFDVQKDDDRPFIVKTEDVEIRVYGTKFNVYRQADKTTVTVLEGNVTVLVGQAGTADAGAIARLPNVDDTMSISLSGGEQAIVDTAVHSIRTVAVAHSEKYVAWTDRRLIFDNTPLVDIFSEFSRYNDVRYRISSDSLAELRLTVVFEGYDLESLISYLEYVPHVTVFREDGVIVVDMSKDHGRNQ